MFKAGVFRGRGGISPVQFLILLQLRKQSKYGYEVLKALQEEFGVIWKPRTGTVYPALRRLEARGFVETEVRDEREFYSLTEKGEELLREVGEYLEGDLEFAERYYKFVLRHMPPFLRTKLLEHIKKRLYERGRWPPIFLHLIEEEIRDEKARLELLKRMKEFLQARLVLIDERIKELEGNTKQQKGSLG